jgi:thiamine-phosphate pyrophosphorylase
VTLPDPPLLIVTDRGQAAQSLPDVLDAAFSAGCRWASVREKDLPDPSQIAWARILLPIARRWGARLTLHGTPGLAKKAGVDGVHLAAGGNPSAARVILGARALIGVSLHSVEEAARLDPTALDYAIAGPVFSTESKPGYGPALGVDNFAAIARATSVPVIAIGGIRPPAIPELLRAGAAGIAVMGSIMRAETPMAETRFFLWSLDLTKTHAGLGADSSG